MTTDSWLSWYPGMMPEKYLIQYDVLIRRNISNVFGSQNTKTIITLQYGEVICSGGLDKKHPIIEEIFTYVKLNERSLKDDLLTITKRAYTAYLERKYLCL